MFYDMAFNPSWGVEREARHSQCVAGENSCSVAVQGEGQVQKVADR